MKCGNSMLNERDVEVKSQAGKKGEGLRNLGPSTC